MVRRVARMFCAVIICGPEYFFEDVKIWSWVVLVRPSKRRLIPRRTRPHVLLFSISNPLLDFDLDLVEDGWWRVKTATPAVTKATTRYLYSG